MNQRLAYVLVALLIVNATFFAGLNSNTTKAQGSGTSVGGIISVDSTWTPVGNPYIFVDNVTVAKNITLTIMPGTVIDLKLANFIIDGTLNAKGNDTNWIILQAQKRLTYSWPPRIYFNSSSTSWDENTGTGSIIDHAQLSVPNYQYETIIGDYPKISNNIIYNYGNDAGAVRTYGLVYNNTILGGYRGIVAQFNQTILSNTIKDADVGISCGYMSSDPIYHPTIIGNLLINNTVGIDDYGCDPIITNNTIANSNRGIFLTSYAFYRNAAPTVIMYNNIYANNFNVYVEAKNTTTIVSMPFNWWGTSDSSKIAQLIYDRQSDPTLARVTYAPFLNAPNPEAPTSTEINPNLSPTTSPTSAPTPNPTITPSPSPNQTPTTTPTPSSSPQKTVPLLDLTSKSTTSYTNFKVDIKGDLTNQGTPISDSQILLSYSVNEGDSWIDLTTVHTDNKGEFLATWTPQVTGEYLLKATSKESETYSSTMRILSFAILPFQEQNVFSVESNSTITSLNFNPATNQFSFTINGMTGTNGYVRATISKTIMANSENIKVYLDGNPIGCSITSDGDSWVVTFTYHHSTHQVIINQEQINHSAPIYDTYLPYILAGIILAFIGLPALIIWRRKSKTLLV